jgi:DNA-binding CsgD family transcriptional regulator
MTYIHNFLWLFLKGWFFMIINLSLLITEVSDKLKNFSDPSVQCCKRLEIDNLSSPFNARLEMTINGIKHANCWLSYVPIEQDAIINADKALESVVWSCEMDKKLCRFLLRSPDADFKAICLNLKVSWQTAKASHERIMKGFGVSDRFQLIKVLFFGDENLPFFPQLSAAENRVLSHLAAGSPLSEVARDMVVAVLTVREHLASIMKKTEAASPQAALVQLANGLTAQARPRTDALTDDSSLG